MVKEVIPTFDDSQQQQLRDEAQKWRLPYWDWAAKKHRGGKNIYDAALILKDREVTVLNSTGQSTIANPLWQFKAKNGEAMGKWGVKHVQYNDDPVEVRSTASTWYNRLTESRN
jgi:tyrosinase